MQVARLCLGILFISCLHSCEKDPPAPLPNANFFVDNANCASSCWVKFYDQSYSAQSWHWDFGNGITSTSQNDSILYYTPGFYNVTLTVWNADNVEDQIVKQIAIL